MIEMSSILQKFSRYGPLHWHEVSEAARKVVTELQSLDPELHGHLARVLDEGVHGTAFIHNVVPEVLLSNPDRAKKTWNELKKKKKKDWKPKDHDHFGKLELWIRKWISEAFVGIISHEELLYIYDILFMHHWKPEIFVTLSLLFLGMLRPWIMRTSNNKEAVTVLLEEADKLYVNDIRKCLVLLNENRKNFYMLAEANTNYVVMEKEKPKEQPKEPEEPKEKDESPEDEEGENEAEENNEETNENSDNEDEKEEETKEENEGDVENKDDEGEKKEEDTEETKPEDDYNE